MTHFESIEVGTQPDEKTVVDADAYIYQLGTKITTVAAALNALLAGVAAGYKLARGNVAATASASLSTGLATVVDFAVSCQGNTATKANACVLASGKKGVAAGYLQIFRFKHTNSTTNTLVAATTAGTVEWIAVGT